MGSEQSGSLVDYTVALSPYDLFPTLDVEQGQTTVLNNPSQVEVYVTAIPLAPQHSGTRSGHCAVLLRFYGLVFSDNGTPRAWIAPRFLTV